MKEDLNDIIKACQSGKLKAQEKLFKMFSKQLFAVCLIYTKDYSSAEEVLQESFLAIFQHIVRFENRGSFEGWMRRIVVNTALNRYRKKTSLYRVEEIEDHIDEFSYEDVTETMSANDIMDIIYELTPQYRMVFCLYAIEGYSHQEISKKLNISEGTSKSNLSRARKILQEKLLEYYQNADIKPNLMVVD